MHESGARTPQLPRRRDRLIQSARHDPYRSARRLPDPTDIHLARALGRAFHSAYQGGLEQVYSEQENLVRVTWSR